MEVRIMMKFIIVIILYTTASAYGLYKLKASAQILSPEFLVGAFFYGAGFLIWIAILRYYPLSIAFPVAAGCLMIATQLVGYYFLKEAPSPLQLSGAGLILAGVTLMFIPYE